MKKLKPYKDKIIASFGGNEFLEAYFLCVWFAIQTAGDSVMLFFFFLFALCVSLRVGELVWNVMQGRYRVLCFWFVLRVGCNFRPLRWEELNSNNNNNNNNNK